MLLAGLGDEIQRSTVPDECLDLRHTSIHRRCLRPLSLPRSRGLLGWLLPGLGVNTHRQKAEPLSLLTVPSSRVVQQMHRPLASTVCTATGGSRSGSLQTPPSLSVLLA